MHQSAQSGRVGARGRTPSLEMGPQLHGGDSTHLSVGEGCCRALPSCFSHCPTLCNPMDWSLPGSSVHGDSPGKNTEVGCCALLQGIFLTWESNPCLLRLPHCRRILYCGAQVRLPTDVSLPLRSGLTHEAHRKEVEQVYLRCSAGTVEWMYPTGALIVNLRPNTFSPSRNLTLCIKPLRGSSGANIYLEKTGELKLLVRDGDLGPGQAPCFGFEQGGLFVEATPQQDISRRTTGFQYELTSRRTGPDLHALAGECGTQSAGVASGGSSPVCWACPPSIISCPHLLSCGRISRQEHATRVWASDLVGLPKGGRGCPRSAVGSLDSGRWPWVGTQP